jgi:predicted RNase H-like nuclease
MAASARLVIGFDVGYSATGRTSGFLLACLTGSRLTAVQGPSALTQADAVRALAGALRKDVVAAVAVDAPVAAVPPRGYRAVERVFSLGRFQTVCKPGSSGAPVGQRLARACDANRRAVATDAGYVRFDELGSNRSNAPVVEAFPTAAMAVFSAPSSLPAAARSAKTDRYFESLIGGSDAALAGIELADDLRNVTNHETRMAVVCALVASWYLTGAYCAVGNVRQGYFLMPAASAWHPYWRAELRSSLDREPGASCIHGSQMPPFVERPCLTAPTRRGGVTRSAEHFGQSVQDAERRTTPSSPPPRLRGRRGATVQIGYVNRNQQKVVLATHLPGTDHGQSVYVLRCGLCGNEYGSNGSDNFQRKCPKCQRGAPGLRYA